MSKVALVRCKDYETHKVYDAVKRAVELIGGMAEFVKPGMKVILKPNLLSPRPPEDGVDTHPEVVRALVRLVKEAGGNPIIGDAPGGSGDNTDEVYDKSGMKKLAEEEGIGLVKFANSKSVDGVPISRHVLDADCLISIPKFKTHGITILTAAVKNTFGCVVGLYKAECHSRGPSEKEFAKIIAKVHGIVKPHLTVLDGIVAMEGDGPATGDLRNMGILMASRDAVAIDSSIAKIIGLEPQDVLVTKEAYEMGLGEAELSRIETVGDDIDGFVVSDFKFPTTRIMQRLPHEIAHAVANLIRFKPVIDSRICTRCNLCKLTCPAHAIEIEKDFCRIDYKKCIRCLCCHEVCPYKAIRIKGNILTKVVWGK